MRQAVLGLAFRDFQVAAPLKQVLPGTVARWDACFPRLPSRGPIEASTKGFFDAYSYNFPRLPSRGPIEA